VLDEAVGHARRLDDDRVRDRAVINLLLEHGLPLVLLGRYAEVPPLLTPCEASFHQLDDAARSRFHFLLAFCYTHLGERQLAERRGRSALEAAMRCGDAIALGRSHMVVSLESFFAGRFREGVQHGIAAVAHLDGTPDWWLGFASWCPGLNALASGDLLVALEAANRTQSIGQARGERRHRSFGDWLAGWAHALAGDVRAAVGACKTAMDHADDPVSRAVASQWLGYAYFEGGDAALAVPLLEQAASQFRRFAFTALEAWASAWLADALASMGSGGEAERSATQAVRVSEQVGFLFGLGLARRALGRARLTQGDVAGAIVELERARDTFAAIEARYEVARTRLELATAVRRAGDPADAARHLAEAQTAFQQLGVQHWIKRAGLLARG
jgi:tetratricopeptide (TPR) repeat protein